MSRLDNSKNTSFMCGPSEFTTGTHLPEFPRTNHVLSSFLTIDPNLTLALSMQNPFGKGHTSLERLGIRQRVCKTNFARARTGMQHAKGVCQNRFLMQGSGTRLDPLQQALSMQNPFGLGRTSFERLGVSQRACKTPFATAGTGFQCKGSGTGQAKWPLQGPEQA